MKRSLKSYEKQLNSLKFNKFNFVQHKIDSKTLAQSYKGLGNLLNEVCAEENCFLEDLIKYENWLVGDK